MLQTSHTISKLLHMAHGSLILAHWSQPLYNQSFCYNIVEALIDRHSVTLTGFVTGCEGRLSGDLCVGVDGRKLGAETVLETTSAKPATTTLHTLLMRINVTDNGTQFASVT